MSVVATLLVRVAANLSELDKTFSELERGAARIAKTYNKLGGQLQSIGSRLTTSVTLPLVAVGAAAAKSAIDFDTAMKGVQAAIVPTTEEVEQLKQAAIEWGQKTQFSATEAAQALGELGKAGIKTTDSIALLPSVLNLATVGEMDLASAATLTTDTLAQFKLEAKDAERVNDVLAAAAQASTTSVKELGGALVYAGPVAASFGMSIEETGAALAQFAKLGFKGEMAGTALRNILTEVKNPAKGMRDVLEELGIKTLASADGTVHLAEVIQKLSDKGATGAQIMQAFGDRAGPAMVAAVSRGAEEVRVLTTAMENSEGTAKRVAETLLSGVGGALEKMRGAVETAGISLGTLLAPALTHAADLIGRLAEWVSGTLVPAFQALPDAVQVAIGGFLGIAAAIGPLIYVAGTLASSYGALAGLFVQGAKGAQVAAKASEGLSLALVSESIAAKLATFWTGALEAVVAVLASPITGVVLAVGALVIGLRLLTGSWEGVVRVLSLGLADFETLERVWENLKGIGSSVSDLFYVIGDAIGHSVDEIRQSFIPAIDEMKRLVTDVGNALRAPFVAAMKELGGTTSKVADDDLKRFARSLVDVSQKLALQSVLLQLRGQLVAVTYAFSFLAKGAADFVNMTRMQLLFTIESLRLGFVNTINATIRLASFFGVDLPAAIRKSVEWLKTFGIDLTGAGGGISAFLAKVSATLPSLSNLANAQRKAASGGQAAADAYAAYVPGVTRVATVTELAGIATTDFSTSLGDQLATAAVTATRTLAPSAEVIARNAEAAKKAAAEAKRAAEEFKKFQDQISGRDAIAKAEYMTRVLASLTEQGLKPSAAGAKDVSDALDDAADAIRSSGGKVSDEMGRLWASLQPPTEVTDDLRNWGDLFGRSISRMIPTIKQNLRPVTAAMLQAFQIPDPNLGAQVEKFLRGAALKDRISKWGVELKGQVTGILAGMFTGQTGFEDGFRSMFGGLQSFANSIIQDFGREFMNELNDVFEGGDFDIENLFGGEKSKGAGAAAGAAVGLTVGLAFGKAFGKEVGALVGAGAGAAMGAVYGGWVGAGVGAAVGAVSGYLGGITQEKAQKAALENAKSQLLATFGTMENLGRAATQAGVSIDEMFRTDSPEQFTRLMNRLNEELAKNKVAVENIAKAFDRATESGTLLSRVDLSRMALNLGKLPTAPDFVSGRGPLEGSQESTFAFIGAQQNAALAGLDTFLSNATVKTQAGAEAIGASLAGIYQTLLESGKTPTQAFAQLEPVIAKFQAQMVAAKLTTVDAFAPLGALATMAASEIGGPVMDAMAGLAQGLTSTANLGLLNQDSFHGFAQEILNGYKQMEALGQGGEVALAGAREGIQRLWELSTDFGFKLNEDEQAMVDFGIASGTVGDKFREPADRMATAIEALVDRMEKFLLKFEEIAPAASDASRAIERTIGGVKIPPIDIPFRPRWEEDYPGGSTAPPRGPSGASMVALAGGGVVTRPTVALIGESGPEAVVPLSKDFGAETDVVVMLDSEVLTRAVLRKQPRIMRAYGAAR